MALLRTLHIAAFVVPFTVFTVMLLVPKPLPEMELDLDFMFFVNKAAHSGGYAYLTVIGFLLFGSAESRWAVVVFMMLHGVGTEIGQTYTGRHGCIQDVLIDWAGITAGFFAARWISRYLTSKKSHSSAAPDSQSPSDRPE